jgi:hypothetical protein
MEMAGTKEPLLEVHKIGLRIGETRKLELGGLGTAGYVWEYQIDGLPDVVSVFRELEETSQPLPPVGSSPNTSSINELFAVKGLIKGETKIRFRLRRPWERDKPPLREVLFEVSISE